MESEGEHKILSLAEELLVIHRCYEKEGQFSLSVLHLVSYTLVEGSTSENIWMHRLDLIEKKRTQSCMGNEVEVDLGRVVGKN